MKQLIENGLIIQIEPLNEESVMASLTVKTNDGLSKTISGKFPEGLHIGEVIKKLLNATFATSASDPAQRAKAVGSAPKNLADKPVQTTSEESDEVDSIPNSPPPTSRPRATRPSVSKPAASAPAAGGQTLGEEPRESW